MLARNYKAGVINDAILKATNIPREEALKKVRKKENERPVFVIQYDPRLPSISGIVKKHWRTMTSIDPKMKETFPFPPLVAYRVPPT